MEDGTLQPYFGTIVKDRRSWYDVKFTVNGKIYQIWKYGKPPPEGSFYKHEIIETK